MTKAVHAIFLATLVAGASSLAIGQQPPAQPPKQPTTVELPPLTGEAGTPPRLAVPDLLALSNDKETQDAARVIAQVLWDDFQFEREFYMIPRDTYRTCAITRAGAVGIARFRRRARLIRFLTIAGANWVRTSW